MHSIPVSIENKEGIQLSAVLDLPVDDQPLAYALFAHCFTCSKDLKSVRHLSNSLTGEGFAVLRFDFTGLGQSEGLFEDTGFSTNMSDLEAACRWLETEHEAPRIMIGHSLGGAAVLHAASKMDSVKAVATIGSPFEPGHVTHLFSDKEDELRENGIARVSVGGRPFTIKKQFLDDLDRTDTADLIRNLNAALLVMHSPIDDIVGIENAELIYKAAKHPKSFVSLDTADHLLLNEADARYAGSVLAAWSRKYLDVEQPEAKKRDEDQEHAGWGITAQIGRDLYETSVVAGGHHMTFDEPASHGGTNKGPSPVNVMMASLGACTAITLRMYVDRKEWPVDSIKVELEHDRLRVDEYDGEGLTPDAKGMFDYIKKRITVKGEGLTDDQLARMKVIAEKCPVNRIMTGELVMDSDIMLAG